MSGDDEPDNDDDDDHPQRNRSLRGGDGRLGGGGGEDEDHDEARADEEERADARDGDGVHENTHSGDEVHEDDRVGADETPGADAPLSDLRRDVDDRREQGGGGGGDDGDDFEELFAEMEVEDVDEDAVWEALAESGDEPVVDPDAVTADTGVTGDTDGDVTVVEKSLCHGCPNFAAPPETACTHDGTTIAAEVDTEHFRVVDCPIVAQREARDDPSDFSADTE